MADKMSGFFGFIDILKGLSVIPKIIMFLGIVAVLSGFFSGAFSLFHNIRISGGVALMLMALGWREWEHARWTNPGPPYEHHWDFGKVFSGLFWYALSAGMFYVAYRTA
jgi:hypothetical protein